MAASSSNPISSENYEIRASSIPSAGKGMFAKRPFAAGDYIIAEDRLCSALLALDSDGILKHSPGAIDKAIEDLTPTELDSFRALRGSNDRDIWMSNAYKCPGSPGSTSPDTSAIFPTLARINHSCDPNAEPEFHGLVKIRAKRDIAAGDEIFISYKEMSEDDDREKRWEALKNFHFECRCPACEGNMTIGQVRRERE